MLTLSYGIKKPQSGDNGSVFFPALEGDLQQLNDHSHNGVDSAKLNPSAITVVTQAISHTGWGAVSGGLYSQNVAMTSPFQYDQVIISMKNAATGDYLFLQVVKIDATNYTVYCNDSSLDLTAVYGV